MLTFNNDYDTQNDFFSTAQALWVEMNRSEGNKGLHVLMKNHEHLNYPPLRVIHSLSEEGKIPKWMLEIRSTTPCQSCLFRNANRKPWRTKAYQKEHKPVNHVHACQIVMQRRGLSPEIAGKPTLNRHAGSQLVIDHSKSSTHVAHLEQFITSSTS